MLWPRRFHPPRLFDLLSLDPFFGVFAGFLFHFVQNVRHLPSSSPDLISLFEAIFLYLEARILQMKLEHQ